jgi:hypothetical protein
MLKWQTKRSRGPVKTYMSGQRYQEITTACGFPSPSDWKFLGVSRRQADRWRLGHSTIDKRTAMLLELMFMKNLKPQNVPQPRPWS